MFCKRIKVCLHITYQLKNNRIYIYKSLNLYNFASLRIRLKAQVQVIDVFDGFRLFPATVPGTK